MQSTLTSWDELVMEGRTNTDQAYRKAVYKEALDFIVDYAVEIPVYQRQNASVIQYTACQCGFYSAGSDNLL